MKKVIFRNIITIILIMIIIFNILIFLIPSKSNALTYNQITINANRNNNNGIDAFPESYKIMLNKLVQDTGHTNWKFKPFYTDIDWNDLTSSSNENQCLRNTIYKSNGAWLCVCGQQGDVGYYCASSKIVNYYLDPRNFLTETTIFQFLDLSNSTVIPVEDIQKAVEGTYLSGTVNVNGTNMSYAQIIYDAANASGENALSLVVKIFQELGRGSTLPGMITGTNPTYPNTYNFFNYGASDGVGNTLRGLAYADSAGWHDPYTALVEGAKLISNSYIAVGQNTKYTFKFDVVDDNTTGLYWHQYMTNIQDPTNQSKMLYDEYLNNGWLNNELTFIIPVYKNMPAYIKLPSNLTTNDGTLYFISSNYYDVTFRSGPGTNYGAIDSLKRNTPVLMLEYNVNNSGWSRIKVNGQEGYMSNEYLTPVNTIVDNYQVPNQPADETPVEPSKPENDATNSIIDGDYIITEPHTKLSNLKEQYAVTSATKDGIEITDDTSLATGTNITIDSKNYVVVKLGDVSGDGEISPIDYVQIKNHIIEITTLTDEAKKKAANVNRDQEISPLDYVRVKNYITLGNEITIE